jgi:hypothetical protein
MTPIRKLQEKTVALSFLIVYSLLLIPSCKKNKDKGTNVVEISEAKTSNIKLISIDFLPGNETVTILTLKNQSTGSAGSVIVKLVTDDAAAIAAGSKVLPANSYTLPTLEYVVPANGTVNVPVIVDRSKLGIDTIYGMGFKIATVSSGTIATDANSIVTKIDLRNRWDGRYKITGTFTDYAAPTITFLEYETDLVTTSPTQVTSIPKDLGIPGYLMLSGGSLSYYGSYGPIFIFDPATNKITSVVNSYGQPAGNTRSAQLDPSGSNQWDPNTKTMTIRFWMNQPNTITTPPYHRTLFINTLIFLKPRF